MIYKETADIIAKLEELNTPFKRTILQELVDWYGLDTTVNMQELFKRSSNKIEHPIAEEPVEVEYAPHIINPAYLNMKVIR